MASPRTRRGQGRLLGTLNKIVQEIPTEEEKQQVIVALDNLSNFVNAVREAIERLPSAGDVEEALKQLELLEASPIRSSVITTSLNPQRPRANLRDGPLTEEEKLAGAKCLDRLLSMSTDSAAGILENSKEFSWKDLRSIAYALGVKSTKGIKRESLVHQIVTKLSNSKGYAALRGSAPASSIALSDCEETIQE